MTHESPAAVAQQLGAAIDRLIGQRTGMHTVTDEAGHPQMIQVHRLSVYAEILSELGGQQGTSVGGVARSLPPAWVDGVAWRIDVDSTVAGWAQQFDLDAEYGRVEVVLYPDTAAEIRTLARLARLATYTWPTDELMLRVGESITRRITEWCARADQLIATEVQRKLEIVAPCPQCGERYVNRPDSAGDIVRQAALQMTVAGCKCLACNQVWSQDHLGHLSNVIDYNIALYGTDEEEPMPVQVEPVTGERNGRAQLTWETVRAIRDDHAAGESVRTLARRYEIGKSQIQRIITNQSWQEGGEQQ